MRPLRLLLPCLVACGVDPAPADVDGLARWLWLHHEDAADGEVTEAAEALLAALGEGEVTGELTRLGPEDVAGVALVEGTDPSLARGWFMARPLACTLDQLEPILVHLDQDELYEGVYDTYHRRHTADVDAFLRGERAFISWEAELTATLLNQAYTERLIGGLRRVAHADTPALLGRVWIPEPAAFEDPDWAFSQDYQVEAWVQRAPGELLHLYGIWRHMDLGGLDTESDGLVNTTLRNMSSWDDQTEALCAEGRP